jgi:AcrR family transcriptional regulator
MFYYRAILVPCLTLDGVPSAVGVALTFIFPVDNRTINRIIESFVLIRRMIDTKQKILDAAERLIAEQGYSATSLRQIIADAGVNLAAVHYHFGSKEQLLNELVMRKAGPVNDKRLGWLDREMAAAAPALPSVDKVLEAFMLPMAAAASLDQQFVKLMGRILAEGLLVAVVEKNFMPVAGRFIAVIRQALPEVPENEFQWRVQFMIGAMAHTMCGPAGADGDFETRIGYLVRFLTAGFHAPAGQPTEVNA